MSTSNKMHGERKKNPKKTGPGICEFSSPDKKGIHLNTFLHVFLIFPH